MATTQAEIRVWLDEAKKQGGTHLIVVCDCFDYEDYPVVVMPGQNVRDVAAANSGPNMTKLMEVYSLTGKHSIESQLAETRSFHYD